MALSLGLLILASGSLGDVRAEHSRKYKDLLTEPKIDTGIGMAITYFLEDIESIKESVQTVIKDNEIPEIREFSQTGSPRYTQNNETQERTNSSPTDSPGYTEKIYNTPDFLQSDSQANFPNKGYSFCAPVSISNSLMWLDDHGFDRLVRNTGDRKADQINLIKQLASEKYINTVSGGGQGTKRIFTGVSRYISSRGYRYKRLEYQGIANPPREYHTGVKIPQLDWIKRGILDYGSVWLKVAWYDHNPETDMYVRGMGHVVTVVGYGVDEGGNENPNIIIIHDPAIRSGEDFANDYVLVEKIDKGAMKTEKGKLLSSAKGFYT